MPCHYRLHSRSLSHTLAYSRSSSRTCSLAPSPTMLALLSFRSGELRLCYASAAPTTTIATTTAMTWQQAEQTRPDDDADAEFSWDWIVQRCGWQRSQRPPHFTLATQTRAFSTRLLVKRSLTSLFLRLTVGQKGVKPKQKKLIKLKDNSACVCGLFSWLLKFKCSQKFEKPKSYFLLFSSSISTANCQPYFCLHLSNCGFFIFINKSKSCLYKRHPKIMFDQRNSCKI